MILKINTDGGARGNPGPAAIGAIARIQESGFRNRDLIKISKYIGKKTNNEAEYEAVIEALAWLAENLPKMQKQPKKTEFYLDSTLVVNQINGKFKINKAHLRKLRLKIRDLENHINIPIIYSYVPREQNTEADRLVNKALDQLENRRQKEYKST